MSQPEAENMPLSPVTHGSLDELPNGQKTGRPTDYTPEIGESILKHMATGLSLAAAAAELGIHRQRVYEWEDRHPEFADTIKLARSKRQLFLERRLLAADQGPVVTSTIFALKNAAGEDWREKIEQEQNVTIRHEDWLAAISGS